MIPSASIAGPLGEAVAHQYPVLPPACKSEAWIGFAAFRSVCPGATLTIRVASFTVTVTSAPVSGFSVMLSPLIALITPTTCRAAPAGAAACCAGGSARSRAVPSPPAASTTTHIPNNNPARLLRSMSLPPWQRKHPTGSPRDRLALTVAFVLNLDAFRADCRFALLLSKAFPPHRVSAPSPPNPAATDYSACANFNVCFFVLLGPEYTLGRSSQSIKRATEALSIQLRDKAWKIAAAAGLNLNAHTRPIQLSRVTPLARAGIIISLSGVWKRGREIP